VANPNAFTQRDHPEVRAKMLNSLATRVTALEAGGGASPVTSVNGRTGAVTITNADVTAALGFALSTAASLTSDTDTTLAANSDLRVATQKATKAYVAGQIANLIASAPGALDTLNELATALGNDPNFATTVTNSIATKLTKASNLSDLTNAATARANLGLGSAATQASSAFSPALLPLFLSINFDWATADGHNNSLVQLTGAAAHTITAGNITAGVSIIIVNIGTAAWTFSCAGGVYKDGATATVASVPIPAGARCTAIHFGGGVWLLSGV
jgi:hypothetical protein